MRLNALMATFLLAAPVAHSQATKRYDDALQDWHDGHYVPALEKLGQLLNGPGGDAWLERVALHTGEAFKTVEVARNGRAPRWSPSGDSFVFETDTGIARVTHLVAADRRATITELKGWGLIFSADGRRVAYLAPRGATTRASAIVVRELATGAERTLDDGGLVKASLVDVSTGPGRVLAIAAMPGETRTEVFGFGAGAPEVYGATDSAKTDAAWYRGLLVYSLGGRSPLAGFPAGRGARSANFGFLDVASAQRREYRGDSWTISADGSTIAYIGHEGALFTLNAVARATGEAKLLKRTTDSVAAPSLSADGSTIAFQQMLDHDWEIFTISRDGSAETRVTREIQHDILPRFIAPGRLLAMIGEPRHRRSYLYDLNTATRTRLFHNNSVRTIAPEYEWAASPDGSKVLIVAERDGDTVTPHRHLYLTDLTQRLTKSDILARLDSNLVAERALVAFGTKAFAPIAATVRTVADAVSTKRIFDYEKALFDFDSKHITRPGNAKARQFLIDAYNSFGYHARSQSFNARVIQGRDTSFVPTANVLATLVGTVNPELVYVISSHFDSRAEGPGADDDASGTAALLEAARVLADHPLPATVVFASMTGEESGLLGSREFVRQVKDSLRVVGVLNNDMIGWANDDRLDNTIRYSNAGIRDLQHAAAMRFSRLVTYDAFYYKSTDAASFYDQYGDIVGGIGSYPVLGNPHYHMPHDLLEYENHELIAETAKTTVASIMLLASSPSRLNGLSWVKRPGDGGTLSWTPSPERSIVKYRVRFRGGAGETWRERVVTTPRVRVSSAGPGTVLEVKAVNARGLEGWDWARYTVRAP